MTAHIWAGVSVLARVAASKLHADGRWTGGR
mgnify:CR=1 FL=1